MECVLICLCCIPALLFVIVCYNIADNNKNKDGYNIYITQH